MHVHMYICLYVYDLQIGTYIRTYIFKWKNPKFKNRGIFYLLLKCSPICLTKIYLFCFFFNLHTFIFILFFAFWFPKKKTIWIKKKSNAANPLFQVKSRRDVVFNKMKSKLIKQVFRFDVNNVQYTKKGYDYNTHIVLLKWMRTCMCACECEMWKTSAVRLSRNKKKKGTN